MRIETLLWSSDEGWVAQEGLAGRPIQPTLVLYFGDRDALGDGRIYDAVQGDCDWPSLDH